MADDQPVDGAEEPKAEVLAFKVPMDLVPDWSDVLEKMGRWYGRRVEVGLEGAQLVVRVELVPEQKEAMLGDLQRTWGVFVADRKRQGRWKAT